MKTLLALVTWLMVSSVAAAADNSETIIAAADVIKQQFFDKIVGQKVAQQITRPVFIEQYAAIEDKQRFAEQFSQALRSISGDNHIGIIFSPEDVKRYQVRELAKVDAKAEKQAQQNKDRQLLESRLANFGIQQLRVLEGNVGYMEMSYFDGFADESAPVFQSAMDFLASAKAIIIDLRRNGGGNSRVLPLFLGYFLGPEPIHFANRIERWKNQTTKLVTKANVQGSRHFDKPIYILTSGTTFSLAEHVTYHLQAFGRATVVGERTYGGGKAFDPVVLNDDYYLRIPRIEMINTKTNAMYQEGKGVSPDIATTAESAFDIAYLQALKTLKEKNEASELNDYYDWVLRVVAVNIKQTKLDFGLPPLTQIHSFSEFKFELRQQNLWMSFRDLPWVKLINLGNGYFYDDRSIQRQFQFKQIDGKLELHVSRLWRTMRVIREDN